MIPLSLPTTSINTRRFTILSLAMLALGAAHIAERTSHWNSSWQAYAAASQRNGPVSLTVGRTAFELPPAYLSTERQRAKVLQDRAAFSAVTLAMTWPNLMPAGPGSDAEATGKAALPVVVELEFSPGRESMRARLDPFYRRLARSGVLSGPNGLKMLRLSGKGARNRDLIVYDPAHNNGFIARCRKDRTSRQTLCHRAIVLASGLELRYRFDQALLAEWRTIDKAVLHKIASFRKS